MKRQKFLKQRLVFHLTKELKQRIDYLQWRAKKLLKQRLDFPLEKRIEMANRLLVIERQKFGETTVRFSI